MMSVGTEAKAKMAAEYNPKEAKVRFKAALRGSKIVGPQSGASMTQKGKLTQLGRRRKRRLANTDPLDLPRQRLAILPVLRRQRLNASQRVSSQP